MRNPNCVRRRLLVLCQQCYDDAVPPGFGEVSSPHRPMGHVGPWQSIDRALVGQIDWPATGAGKAAVIAFRGTLDPRGLTGPHRLTVLLDWLNNTKAALIPFHKDPRVETGNVHLGFKESLENLWPDIAEKLGPLIAGQAAPQIFITGHSKGGALAVLAAMRASMTFTDARIRVITIAAARAGDQKFRLAYNARPNILTDRYEARLDPVPLLPPGPEDGRLTRQLTGPVLALLDRAGIHVDNIRGFVSIGKHRVGGADVRSGVAAAVRGFFGGLFAGAPPKLDVGDFLNAHMIEDGTDYDDLLCSNTGEDQCDHR